MFKSLLKTQSDHAMLIVRVMLGVVMFPHGAQKMLGWFGGGGFSGTIQAFNQMMGIPSFLTFLVIITEFFGAIALIIGAFGRIAAAGIAVIMVVAIFKVHTANGFFMNWYGTQAGEGFEYHLLALAMAVAILIKGSGSLSVDGALSK